MREVVRFGEGGYRLPADWALSAEGHAAVSAGAARAGGALLPLGGDEATDGHKGFALLLLTHCLGGLLAGAEGAPTAEAPPPQWLRSSMGMGAGFEAWRAGAEHRTYTFLVLDPRYLPSGVDARVSALMYIVRHGQSIGMDETVLGPWDLELDNMDRVTQMGGILYRSEVVDALDALARVRGVTPLARRATRPLQPAVDFLGAA